MQAFVDYNPTTDNHNEIYHDVYQAQTFIPAYTGKMQMIKLRLALRDAAYPWDLHVSIQTTSGGSPSGSEIAAALYETGGLDVSPTFTEVSISLGVGCDVVAGTMYAIVLSAPDCPDDVQKCLWVDRITSGTYPSGQCLRSGNAGGTWIGQIWDWWFEVWGTNGGGTPLPDCDLVCVGSTNDGYGECSWSTWSVTWGGGPAVPKPYEYNMVVQCMLGATYFLKRGMLVFDLSGASPITVENAKVRIYVASKDYTGSTKKIYIVEGKHSPPITAADFQAYAVEQTPLASRLMSSLQTGAWNDFVLSPSAYSLIESAVGGYLNLGIRFDDDASNTAPTVAFQDQTITFRGGGYPTFEPLLLANCTAKGKNQCIIVP